MAWLAMDVGGAHLKASDGVAWSDSRPFALWQRPHDLAQELRAMIAEAPPSERLAVTMTGELADCFATKAEGVAAIVGSVEQAADGRHTRFYLTNGKFVTGHVATREARLASAANWHALAQFAARYVPPSTSGLLIDIGSTTSDFICISPAGPLAVAQDDTARLASGELAYTGTARSPVCAVVRQVPYRGQELPVAQEVFATTRDAYILLGDLPEEATSLWTADGRPATKKFCRARMARMIGADSDTFNHRDAITIARAVLEQQLAMLMHSAKKVWSRQESETPAVVVVSGAGEFLAARVAEQLGWLPRIVSLGKELGCRHSISAPAFALAVLAREKLKP